MDNEIRNHFTYEEFENEKSSDEYWTYLFSLESHSQKENSENNFTHR